jgi:hypothetical protein
MGTEELVDIGRDEVGDMCHDVSSDTTKSCVQNDFVRMIL